MDKLIAYLNSLRKPDREDFVERCGTTEGYLRKAASTGQALREKLCMAIERESAGLVRRTDLRSDWLDIWPELVRDQEASHA